MHGNADPRDLPEGVGIYATNLDPVAELGTLMGARKHTLLNNPATDPIAGSAFTVFGNGSRAVFYDGLAVKLITGLPGISGVQHLGSRATTGRQCAVSDGEAVHMGLGSNASSYPQWIGDIGHGQFGGAPPALSSSRGAELKTDALAYGGHTTTPAANQTGTMFELFRAHFWYATLVYDGFQESPPKLILKTYADIDTDNFGWSKVALSVDIVDSQLSQRVTGVNVYRAEATNRFAKSPSTLMTLVQAISINDAGWTVVAGGKHRFTVTDEGEAGQTYYERTGIPDTVDHMQIHYGLSCAAEGYHIVGDCWHKDLKVVDTWLFRSKPYRYDTFDWTSDYLKLGVRPTALISYEGRVYAFCAGRIYRINPATFTVEDVYDGIGALGPESVVVTERGMFFASHDNVYHHDGTTVTPIGDPMLTVVGNPVSGYRDRLAGDPVALTYVAALDMVMVFFSGTSYVGTHAWGFHVAKQTWYYFSEDLPVAGSRRAFVGVDGTAYLVGGNGLRSLFTSTQRMAWAWISGKLHAGGTDATYYRARMALTGHSADTPITFRYQENGEPWQIPALAQDGELWSAVVNTNPQPSDPLGTGLWKKVKSISLYFAGTGAHKAHDVILVRRMRSAR
jgi:hypothetical protein